MLLLAGFLGSAALFGLSYRLETQMVRTEFLRHAHTISSTFQRNLSASLDAVDSLAALYASSESVERDEFRAFAGSLLDRRDYLQALEWAPRVDDDQRAVFEAVQRLEVGPEFRIRERANSGTIAVAARRPEYFPVTYVEPLRGNEAALGFDLASDSTRLAAMARARDTGEQAATQPVHLVQEEPGQQSGVLVLQPIYRNDLPHSSVSERRANLEGFVVGVIRVGDVVAATLRDLRRHDFIFFLSDTAADAGSPPLYHRAAAGSDSSEDCWTSTLQIAGRPWRLELRPAKGSFRAHRSWPIWTLPAVGGLITLLLLSQWLNSSRSAEAIRQSHAALESALGAVSRAKAEADLLNSITERVNSGWELREILDYVYEAFSPVIPYDRIGFAEVEADGRHVRSCWAKSRTGVLRLAADYRAPLAGSSLATIIESGTARILNDLEEHLRAHPASTSTRLLLAEGIRSSLTCPLKAQGKPVGFLFFSSQRSNTYAQNHIRTFERVASTLSVIVQKARLYEELTAKHAKLEEEIAGRLKAERTLSLVFERRQQRYQAGGTLRHDAPCYVERRADRELLQELERGGLCYVLTSRQMGKSSLMVRTSHLLEQRGIGSVALDLTAIGQNLTAEQWYDGLGVRIGWQLQQEDALEHAWSEYSRLSPVQRLFTALQTVVLARDSERFVVFVDELDTVRSLPFSTNEFFAAIRECHNRRAEDPNLERLTFCLLGTVLPNDLIEDPQMTPFNIGLHIPLEDFTPAEAAPLARGLDRPAPVADELLRRVLHWTGGHPYLTLRMCKALTEDTSLQTSPAVDDLCERLFLTAGSRDGDDNLTYARENLLRCRKPRQALEVYARVRSGETVHADPVNPVFNCLDLSGIVRSDRGRLRVRNRIYERVFNSAWVVQQLATLPEP